MSTMIRANRKGGAVAHLLRTADAPSVCGRVMAYVPGGEGLRLCKSCARITGLQMEIDTRVFTDIPELSELPALSPEWARIENEWLREGNSFVLNNAREVLAQYDENPSEYDMSDAGTVRLLAKYRAYIKLHTGRDYRDPVDSVAPSMNRRGGDGMVNRNSKSVARSIVTANQRVALCKMDAYMNSLINQYRELKGEEKLTLEPIGDEWFDKLKTRADIDRMFKAYSTGIDKLKAEVAELRKNAPKPELPSKALTVGLGDICKYNDKFYKVKVSQSGNPYAMVWDGNGWDYESARGVIRKLTPEHLATAEDAAQFGHMFHRCVFCSRPLADERSESVGYGPDCAEKRSLPWG